LLGFDIGGGVGRWCLVILVVATGPAFYWCYKKGSPPSSLPPRRCPPPSRARPTTVTARRPLPQVHRPRSAARSQTSSQILQLSPSDLCQHVCILRSLDQRVLVLSSVEWSQVWPVGSGSPCPFRSCVFPIAGINASTPLMCSMKWAQGIHVLFSFFNFPYRFLTIP
jgi:hypothetical protein